MEIVLNVYDVTSTPRDPKSGVVRLNNITRAAAVGGIFHGAVQIGSVEFSYGFCERGSGVYAVEAKKNPMYQYRETISLGPTTKSMEEIKGIIQDMKALWPGFSYDLLNRNCCHFCADLAQRLGVQPVPGWLNRFASAAATTVAVTQETVRTMQDIGQELGRLSNESFSFVRATWHRTVAATMQQQQQITQRLQQQRVPNRPQSAPVAAQAQQQAAPAVAGSVASGQGAPRAADGSNGGTVSDYPADYYGQQPSTGGGSGIVSNSSSSSRQAGGGNLAAAGQSLLAGVQQAGQQLKATTSRLGFKLQQQVMKGNAVEQQSWEQALSPTAAAGDRAAAAGHGPFAAAPAGGPTSAASSDQQQQLGPLHQGLLPGAQPKLADQFCVTSRSIGHEDDPFASLLEGDGEQRGIASSQQ